MSRVGSRGLLFFFALTKACVIVCAAVPRGALLERTAPTLTEINLGRPDKGVLKDGVAVSANSRHVGYPFGRGGGTTNFGTMLIAEGGAQVVIDGKRESNTYELVSLPVFSEDGRHYAYSGGPPPGRKGGKMLFVVDGREHDDGVSGYYTGSPRFSPDGERVAYIGKPNDETMVVIANGKKGRVYTKTSDVVFSPDSKNLAYSAQRDGKWCLVNEGIEGPLYDAVGESMPIFSPDSKHVAYVGKRGEQWILNLDGKESPPIDEIYSPRFNPNGNGFAWCAKKNKQAAVFYNGKPLDKVYDGVTACVFSPDGMRTAHLAQRGGKWLAVIDGGEGDEYKDVDVPIFSGDGKHVAYVATETDGLQRVVIDGRKGPLYAATDAPLLSADGKHLVYNANLGKARGSQWCVIKDGVEGTPYQDVKNVAMSEDGEHIAHWIFVSGKHQLMVDGHVLATYDGTFDKARIVFDSKTSLHALGYRDGVIYRAEVQVDGAAPTPTPARASIATPP
jgi:Tol biopolymer transport system component